MRPLQLHECLRSTSCFSHLSQGFPSHTPLLDFMVCPITIGEFHSYFLTREGLSSCEAQQIYLAKPYTKSLPDPLGILCPRLALNVIKLHSHKISLKKQRNLILILQP